MKFKWHFRIILFIFLPVFLTGCPGFNDSSSNSITGKFIVVWIDSPANQKISEQLELNSQSSTQLIPEYVFAVGHDNDFIIAKQHPTSGFKAGFDVDATITNYYIIDMNSKIFIEDERVKGPLTKNEFDSLRKILEIDRIRFDMLYPDKPGY